MRILSVVAGATALALAGCGGSGGGGSNSCTPGTTAAITINATSLSPPNACVQPGGTVTFRNADTASHDIVFDTTGCPTVGQIQGGGQANATFPSSGTCTFHDAANPSNAGLRGTVAVTAVQVSGGGY